MTNSTNSAPNYNLTFSLFIELDGATLELGTFNESANGAKIIARNVQDATVSTIKLRKSAGDVNVQESNRFDRISTLTGRMYDLLEIAYANEKSLVCTATDDNNNLVAVHSHHGLLSI